MGLECASCSNPALSNAANISSEVYIIAAFAIGVFACIFVGLLVSCFWRVMLKNWKRKSK